MPGYLSHCVFSFEVLKKAPQEIKEIISNNLNAFVYGSQGPDNFFYYHSLPWQNKKDTKEIYKFGTRMHNENINKAFKSMLENIENDFLISYVAGYLCHHALDSSLHPYVYSVTDYDKTFVQHCLLEAQLDLFFLENYNYQMKDINYKKQLKISNKHLRQIININVEALKPFKTNINEKHIKESFVDIKKALFFIYDPTGRKYKLIKRFENLFKLGPVGTKMMPNKNKQDKSILNLEHHDWVQLANGVIRNEDCFQLFEQALKQANIALELLNNYLKKENGVEDILELINNKSYNTGI